MGWFGSYLVRELEHGIVGRQEEGISTGQEVWVKGRPGFLLQQCSDQEDQFNPSEGMPSVTQPPPTPTFRMSCHLSPSPQGGQSLRLMSPWGTLCLSQSSVKERGPMVAMDER